MSMDIKTELRVAEAGAKISARVRREREDIQRAAEYAERLADQYTDVVYPTAMYASLAAQYSANMERALRTSMLIMRQQAEEYRQRRMRAMLDNDDDTRIPARTAVNCAALSVLLGA